MLKTLFTFLVVVLFVIVANAQSAVPFTDTVTYYAKNRQKVFTVDSAYYVHKILPLDREKNLYPVVEYFKNGKPKLKAYTQKPDGTEYNGNYFEYFENGGRKSMQTYLNGKPVGKAYKYYPNGELYTVEEVEGYGWRMLECRDTTGVVVAQNGEGTWLVYDQDNENFIISGPVVNGKKDGEWSVKVNDDITEVELYSKLEPVKGYFKNKRGQFVEWSNDIIPGVNYSRLPMYKGGVQAFGRFLAKTIRYPAAAREKNVQGRVYVSFVITDKGKLTNFKIEKGIGFGCDEEVLRVMKLSPDWIPRYVKGKAVEEFYTVPIAFNLAND
ncbi:TonB family protein [Mucilaginibacter roseus]|uniref:TonB family protein n=1 Tax=Mucilaginibacter roseus TaxID=1528868 RepID=A0ABS8U3K2_9SPHI|nr:energy transducer TonB [Mucilaginibacter roseus]MCD8740146.1 TonB family protein [Mucilaginibacter roseus]